MGPDPVTVTVAFKGGLSIVAVSASPSGSFACTTEDEDWSSAVVMLALTASGAGFESEPHALKNNRVDARAIHLLGMEKIPFFQRFSCCPAAWSPYLECGEHSTCRALAKAGTLKGPMNA